MVALAPHNHYPYMGLSFRQERVFRMEWRHLEQREVIFCARSRATETDQRPIYVSLTQTRQRMDRPSNVGPDHTIPNG